MIGKLLLPALFIFGLNAVKAQDQLFLNDNSRLLVKVIEIGPNEIKYKLFSNPEGPTYIKSRQTVLLIIYESGTHEIINKVSEPNGEGPDNYNMFNDKELMKYYRYSNNVSLNFLSFFNNEVGLLYTAELFKSQLNVMVPVAFGLGNPGITDAIITRNFTHKLLVQKKNFELGVSINYYPTPCTNVNYFIGPSFRFMQLSARDTYYYSTIGTSYPNKEITKYILINRFFGGINNGLVIRSRSRLQTTILSTIGYKNDSIENPIIDPNTGNKTNPISSPLNFYFSCGVNIGYSF